MQKLLFNAFSIFMILTLALAFQPAGSASATASTCNDVDRGPCTISGYLHRPNGEPWPGIQLPYNVKGVGDSLTAATLDDGFFSFQVDYGDHVTLIPDPNFMDGYGFGSTFGDRDVWNDIPGIFAGSGGRRSSWGHIGGPPGPCKANAKVRFEADPDLHAIVREGTTDAEGNYNVDSLEPVSYTVTPSKTGCTDSLGGSHSVYQPAAQDKVFTGGDEGDVNFEIPRVRLMGQVHLAPPKDHESVATGLLASFRPNNDTTDYTVSVNWIDGNFNIENIPANLGGKVTISRVGGSAAFGYVSSTNAPSATPPTTTCSGCYTINIDTPMLEGDTWQSVILTGARTISGTIGGSLEPPAAASNTPLLEDATVHFTNDLDWTQTWRPGLTVNGRVDGTAYLINNAQPRLYYLSPVMDGIRAVSPTRSLANLTATASTTANFTLTWQKAGFCMRNNNIHTNSGEPPVFQNFSGATAPFRLKAAVGTIPYYYAYQDTCSGEDGWAIYPFPYGMFGMLEVNNHTLSSANTIEPKIWDSNWDYNLQLNGDRTLTGKLIALASPWVNFDQKNFEDRVQFSYLVQGSVPENYTADNFWPWYNFNDQTRELTYSGLEHNKYQLKLNGSIQGFTISPLVTTVAGTTDTVIADLTGADRDMGTLFKATHIDIDPASMSLDVQKPYGVHFSWNRPPEYNDSDKPNWYQLQVGDNSATFTDSSPLTIWVKGTDNGNNILDTITYDWSPLDYPALLNKTLKWRVRVAFGNDYGLWKSPGWSSITTNSPGDSLGVVFTQPSGLQVTYGATGPTVSWSAYPAASNYNLRFSPFSDFHTTENEQNLAAITFGPITSGLTPETIYYWHVDAETGGTTAISFWSNPAVLYYGWQAPDSADYTKVGTNLIFNISDSNSSYPDNARYQVQYQLNSIATYAAPSASNTWLSSTPPPNGTPWTQSISALANGTYKWRVRLTAGTVPITDWTDGSSTFIKP